MKPALVDSAKMIDLAKREGKGVIITSYMDHAIGQLWAAYWAGKSGVTHDCGLLTHELFEPDSFFKAIKTRNAYIKGPNFVAEEAKSLLQTLSWERF